MKGNISTDISVIITNYNYSKYLNRAIRSALTQSVPPETYEVIVVDDASTDWSKELIASYGKLIRPVYLECNMGLAAARNVGIGIAKGQYVVFLDADDYISRNLVFVESLYLNLNPTWQAVACDYDLINDDEQVIERKSCGEVPIACGIMFRKEALEAIGGYDESFRMHEERDLCIRFSQKYDIHRIELPLYRYRKHGQSLSNNYEVMLSTKAGR